jgi:hypothetical protein
MTDEEPRRDPALGEWLSALDHPVDPERVEHLARQIRAEMAARARPGLGQALLPWWKVVVPLAAAAGLGAVLILAQARDDGSDATGSAVVLLEAMTRQDGGRYLSEVTAAALAEGLASLNREVIP